MRYFILILTILSLQTIKSAAQQAEEPWTASQLMAPESLAGRINHHQTDSLLILCVGPDATIKGSVDLGPAHNEESLSKLKAYLTKVPKDREIVIYCGCCPFSKCPNIRPAFNALKALGYKNAKLLDLPKNVKVDWIDNGYPVTE